MFYLCITWRGRYHWIYIGLLYPIPCCDQTHGPCLCVIHLVSLRQGKAHYAMDRLSTNRPLADSKVDNVDPCPREGEGAQGSNRHRVWLSLFAQCSASGWLLGFVSWRAEDGLVLEGPMSSLSGTRINGGVVRRCLHRSTYSAILGLRGCFVENPRWRPNLPVRWCRTEGTEMVRDRGSETLVVPTRWDLLRVALGGASVWTWGAGVGFTESSVGRRLRVTYEGCVLQFK